MTAPRETHVGTLITLIKYIVFTENRGLVLSSKEWWSSEHKFKINGWSDSDDATNPNDCRSISGGRVFMNGARIAFCSVTQKFVTLSMTEAEITSIVMVAQDMLYVYQLLELLELKVELPMILEMDTSGAVDIAESWSIGGRTHHVDVCNYFLCELKDQGLFIIWHTPCNRNDVDIFTMNVTLAVFNCHVPLYGGSDEYVPVTSIELSFK
jgi:hypothetical protein